MRMHDCNEPPMKRLKHRRARGAAYTEMLALILFIAIVAATALPILAFSINRMFCGMAYGQEDREIDGRSRYFTDSRHGTHCWKWRWPGPSPGTYYF